jgi:hypothetical protein
VDIREYLRIIQVGKSMNVLRALRFYTDYNLTWKKLDAKIVARAATVMKPIEKNRPRPKFKFGPKFFTKLNMMPAVSIDVMESRSHIRKTCYGFRDRVTGERVYVRVDPGSVVEFRDSPSGYLLGTRYLVPNIDRMKPPRWDKVSRLLTRLLTKKGIIITASVVQKYRRSAGLRVNLAKRLIELRKKHRIHAQKRRKPKGR